MLKTLVSLARLFFGVLTLVAIIIQLNHSKDLGVYDPVNFFSYFTNLSNIFAAAILLCGAYAVAIGRKVGQVFEVVRGASVLCMVLVGIVYGILLSNEDLGALLPWVNAVLHYTIPVVMLVDWLLWPPKTTLRTGYLKYWLIFPAVYLLYTLVRGAAVGWYPYPFVNPDKSGGYPGVMAYCVVITIAFALCGWLLITYTNRVVRKQPASSKRKR